jgi:type II secretion system protein H
MSHPTRDGGFTLIEALVTVSLMGVMMAIAVGGWSSWAQASAHSGAAREIQSAMRQAQQQAVTEGRAMCFLFDDAADSYSVYRGRCSDATKVKVLGPRTLAAQVRISAPSFTSAAGTPAPGATFQGRGTGSPGDVEITRDGSSKVYTLSVDWLTGRVSLS